MTSYVDPKKATAFIFGLGLPSQANATLFQANPTLAAGDVKISKDGGAFANLTNLPTVNPAGGKRVEVSLTAAEMTADNVSILFSDVAGAEWCDTIVGLQTVANQIDDLGALLTATPNASADALLDRVNGIETGFTVRQGMRLLLAVLAGKAIGMSGTAVTFRDMADTKDRIQATVDAFGNRSAIIRDVT